MILHHDNMRYDMAHKTPHVSIGILLSTFLLLSACGTSSTTGNTLPPNKGPQPTVVITNTAPSNIDISFGVGILQDDPNQPARFSIAWNAIYQGNLVTFQQGEKMECNSLLVPNGGSKVEVTPIPAAGTVYNCMYTSPQGKTSFSFTVPGRLTITSPASGATITRSTSTPYTMTVLPDCKSTGIGLDYPDGRGGMAGFGNPASINCGTNGTTDTTKVTPGPGGLVVEEFLQPAYATNNPGFHSFTMQIYTSTTIPVTWQ